MKTYHLIFCLLLLNFSCQKKIQHFAYHDNHYFRLEGKQKAIDTSAYKIILPYKEALDKKMNEVIGYNTYEMVKAKPASTLTNFIADATLAAYKKSTGKHLDAVISNYGGIRLNSFGPGDVLVGEIYELMPFENILIVVQVKGREMMLLLNKMAKAGGWPISKGSGFSIKDSLATNVSIDNAPFDYEKTYAIGLPDYVANGGDDADFLKTLPREETGLLIRELIIQYVKENKTLAGDKSMRIRKE
jgi:2',3'-cyclic-nucleotide 2'-phosphodiesterase (5'-nucleotidase family)